VNVEARDLALVLLAATAPGALVALVAVLRGYRLSLTLRRHGHDEGRRRARRPRQDDDEA
jgi:hypothetical protein